jgi:hypothetical protein
MAQNTMADPTVLSEALRVFRRLRRYGVPPTYSVGFYLSNAQYDMRTEDVKALIQYPTETNLVRLVEAALAADDAPFLVSLRNLVELDVLLHLIDTKLGLGAFWAYAAVCCLTVYLDWVEPETWQRMRELRLFDQDDADRWRETWATKHYENYLAVLYLLHFKGGIPATSLLQKCVQHGFTAFYKPLIALGATFSTDDIYRMENPSTDDVQDALDAGLLKTLEHYGTKRELADTVRLLLRAADAISSEEESGMDTGSSDEDDARLTEDDE